MRVMYVYYVPRSFQFTTSGVPKAIAGIKKAIIAGHIHFARLDIKDHFSSFVPAMLVSEPPCPQGTVEGVVCGRTRECENPGLFGRIRSLPCR